jgi:coenzyme F420 biosynthesis associated uncharacterized protein
MTDSGAITVGRAVDWDFAGSFGAWLSRPGGPVTDYTRDQAITELAVAAVSAEGPVRDVTRLDPGRSVPDARIVNRQDWVRAAAHSMRAMTGGSDKPTNFIAGRITGAQTGAVLAFISSGILGQYDPFADTGSSDAGELLLVYPNVIAVERELRVSPSDFRMWVCLHEVTHRVQFTANPWLADHMSSALQVLTSDGTDDLAEVASRLAESVKERVRAKPAKPVLMGASGSPAHADDSGILGFLRVFQTPAQRDALDQLLVLGTLLEGHADYVMDAVGPAVVPTVEYIRGRFDRRRQRKQPPIQRLLRALLGFEAKMNQYTRGKAFVEQVVDRVGIERFNAVWSSPDTLPRPVEIGNPQQWIDRVL